MFLRNAWYCAGWSTDLRDAPLGRRYLGEHIVLYRKEDGGAVALEGVCPHRFAPFERGVIRGDAVQCGYHGLRLGPDGRCVHNPHGNGHIPSAARVRSYPIVERDGAIWIWMGDPDLADADKIVDTSIVVDREQLSCVTGYLLVHANYKLVIDNLLDLTHVAYLHPTTFAGPPEDILRDPTIEFREEDGRVYSNYLMPNVATPPQMAPLFHEPQGDLRAHMQWEAPCNLSLEVSITSTGRPKEDGVISPTLHLLVPQDENHTHYYFAFARNVEIHDSEQDRIMHDFVKRAFEEEDEPIVRACQEMMGTTDLFSLQPVLLKTDTATVRARRILDKLVQYEHGPAAQMETVG